MSRTAALAAMGHGVSFVGHHVHHVRFEHAYPRQADRPVTPVSATTRPGALDLLLFSFAAGSGWGPARRWKLTTRNGDKGKAPVY